jgi:hypothetical protein
LPKLFLGVLAIAWIVVLVPPVLRARNDSKSRGDSIGDFQNRLGVLGHSNGSSRRRRAARSMQGQGANLGPMPGVGSPAIARRMPANRGGSNLPLANRLGPPRLSNRSSRPTLARPLTGPVEPLRTRASEQSSRRRREVVTVLFTLAVLSAAVASALGGSVWWALQIVADLLLLTYFGGMLFFRNAGTDRARTVHYLPQVRPRPVPAYALRRTASN